MQEYFLTHKYMDDEIEREQILTCKGLKELKGTIQGIYEQNDCVTLIEIRYKDGSTKNLTSRYIKQYKS